MANIEKTAFGSVEEAAAGWNVLNLYSQQVGIENKEYEDYMMETVMQDHGQQILSEVMMEFCICILKNMVSQKDMYFINLFGHCPGFFYSIAIDLLPINRFKNSTIINYP